MLRPAAALLLLLAAGATAEMDGIGTYYGGAPVRDMKREREESVKEPHVLAAASFARLESRAETDGRLLSPPAHSSPDLVSLVCHRVGLRGRLSLSQGSPDAVERETTATRPRCRTPDPLSIFTSLFSFLS